MAANCLCSSSALSKSYLSTYSRNSRQILSPRISSTQLRKFGANGALHGRSLVCRAAADGDEEEKKGGRQLWQSELSNELGTFDDEARQSSILEKDIVRFAKKEEVDKLLSKLDGKDQAGDQKGGGLREIADKILVADFFFILFILAWLVAGLGERAALQTTSLIDSWLPLWPSVFQPALGVFMAGAIVSALSKKTSK